MYSCIFENITNYLTDGDGSWIHWKLWNWVYILHFREWSGKSVFFLKFPFTPFLSSHYLIFIGFFGFDSLLPQLTLHGSLSILCSHLLSTKFIYTEHLLFRSFSDLLRIQLSVWFYGKYKFSFKIYVFFFSHKFSISF